MKMCILLLKIFRQAMKICYPIMKISWTHCKFQTENENRFFSDENLHRVYENGFEFYENFYAFTIVLAPFIN